MRRAKARSGQIYTGPNRLQPRGWEAALHLTASSARLVATPPSVLEQWKAELEERFGLVFELLDRAYLTRMRR